MGQVLARRMNPRATRAKPPFGGWEGGWGSAEWEVEMAEPVEAERGAKEAVERALLDFLEAFNNLDWERFVTFFGPDASIFHPDIPEVGRLDRVEGKEGVIASFRNVFEQAASDQAGRPLRRTVPIGLKVQMIGGTALATFVLERGGNSFGRRTFVWQRYADGWKIAHIHASNVTREGEGAGD